MVISSEYVCCSVVFATLGGVFVFSVLMASISYPLWLSVYKCQIVECVFTSPLSTECVMFVMCCISVSTVV